MRRWECSVELVGWYAGSDPCPSISVRLGAAEFPCRPEDRKDVQQVYPGLFSTGFRCVLDLLQTDFEMSDNGVELCVRAGGVESRHIRIAAEPGWADEIRSLRSSGIQYASPEQLGLGLQAGDRHYRSYVGIPAHYDLTAASTFSMLMLLGLRQHQRLVDIGCGSLRTGRLLIPYLNPGSYLGVEPDEWLVREGIRHELGADISKVKRPRFLVTYVPEALSQQPPSHFVPANSIFSHASQPQIREWLRSLARHLTPYGLLAATYVCGSEDYTGQESVYPACIRCRTETMQALAEECSFRFVPLDWRHLHGQCWALFANP
jgi:hypothetical protein